LRHDQIPIETRIITVADIWDAISADRPYRAGMPLQQAIAVMRSLEGNSIDPTCWAALQAALPNVEDPEAKLYSLQGLLANQAAPEPARQTN
jgi:HD-GYP domain-containing protein (c-di-GMP phosphodiesterase class II)